MSVDKPNGPVVVTFREVSRALQQREAVEAVAEVVRSDATATDVERASYAAAIGKVLRELERVEREAGALVLTSPHHAEAKRVDTGDWIGWARVLWEKIRHPSKCPQSVPITSVPEPFPETGRVALVGDWGTGLYGAPVIADTIRKDLRPYAMVMHLGDVYDSGTVDEVRERFLQAWPSRPEAIHRALNSNHEMYASGEGYFRYTLPAFRQAGSYFCIFGKAAARDVFPHVVAHLDAH